MRTWTIREQVIVEPSTKLRFEFTSVHSQCMAKGEEAPVHDRAIALNLYNESGNRVIRMEFTRYGEFNGAIVEPCEGEVPETEQEQIAAHLRSLQTPQEPAEGPVSQTAQQAVDVWHPPLVAPGGPPDPPAWGGVNLAGSFAADI